MTTKKVESLARVLNVAADMFIEHPFEDVSMAAIAHEAHCSTATIYEIYGSKDKLFVAALNDRASFPPVVWDEADTGFEALLKYAHRSLKVASSPEISGVMRAVISQPEKLRSNFYATAIENRGEVTKALDSLIEAALAEGMLRPVDKHTIMYVFRAVTHSVQMLHALLYGPDAVAPAWEALDRLFTPLVTPAAREVLAGFVADLKREDPGATGGLWLGRLPQ